MLQPSRFFIFYFLFWAVSGTEHGPAILRPAHPWTNKKKTLHGRKRYPCVHRHVKARGVQDMGDCNAQRYRSIHPGNQPLHIYIHTLGAHTQHHMDYINIQTRFTPTFVKSTFLLVFKVPRHRKKIKTNKYTTHIELHIVVYALVSEGCWSALRHSKEVTVGKPCFWKVG